MKNKITLLIFFVILQFNCKINSDQSKDFIGHWKSNDTSVQMVIWKDKFEKLQLVQWDTTNGEELISSNLNLKDKEIRFTTKTISTGYVIKSKIILINEDKIEEIIIAENENKEVKIYWDKIK
ncbi:hypothetical protein EHQ96_18350 [Leptospira levettii]|uniref:hypothetical protein n=1 Tax=Leptospira levettii TaxID=2023178 RepID=UPI00108268EF|nr:hypothetical protein [Leptospira levettii]TGM62918.1 hypothetical protein EHQ96_18350 [Leptospira levettii]